MFFVGFVDVCLIYVLVDVCLIYVLVDVCLIWLFHGVPCLSYSCLTCSYVFVRSKQALGRACGVSRPVIACRCVRLHAPARTANHPYVNPRLQCHYQRRQPAQEPGVPSPNVLVIRVIAWCCAANPVCRRSLTSKPKSRSYSFSCA